MSRRCPRCKAVYAGEARFCPKDGSPLVDVAGTSGKPVGGRGTSTAPPEGKTLVRQTFKPPTGVGVSRAASLTDEVIDRRYQIQRKLGEGGMAFVYEARDLATGESVAIKVLSPKLGRDHSSIERLRREVRLSWGLPTT